VSALPQGWAISIGIANRAQKFQVTTPTWLLQAPKGE